MSKYHDDNTAASDPVPIRLNPLKLQRTWPAPPRPMGRMFGQARQEADFIEMLNEHLSFGDSRAALVGSIDPLLIAAYTDELDCIALLRMPRSLVGEYGLKPGSRLLTINTYAYGQFIAPDLTEGPNALHQYNNFFPVIAEFLSDDVRIIAARKQLIDEAEWARCQDMLKAYARRHGMRARNGSPYESSKPARG